MSGRFKTLLKAALGDVLTAGASAYRTALGLVIGTNVQAYSAVLGSPSDSGVLSLSKVIAAGAVRASNVITATTTTAHGLAAGDRVQITGLDATFNSPTATTLFATIDSVPTTTSFTYTLAGSNGSSTAGGLMTPVAFLSGTTPPSGTESHWYWWTRIGNLVFFELALDYTTSAVDVATLEIVLPPDMPAPYVFPGQAAASEPFTGLYGHLGTTSTSNGTAIVGAGIKNNAADNGFLIFLNNASTVDMRQCNIKGSYRVA